MDNKEIITQFYSSFQKLDAAGMNACYSEDIVFSDPVFLMLRGDEVTCMWEMLCKNAKQFSLSFSDIELIDEEYATCKWQASYLFSGTGRKVTNNIKAFMRIKDGKIIEHSDAFRLSTWINKALGWKGVLFSWTGYMKKAVQTKARRSLLAYMEKKYGQQD
ncbi:MAG: nuclear transport factor 2 family protein [Chitinophagaceae bacterium]|nr:nuclear transport factor 2 family protein [Chitinophagaceae bacterium]MCW5925404.1 nuclear transport factor 2 family protein [Chitinophagaceae bacterium]